MEPEFWLARWQQQKIGFHLDEVNALLTGYWSMLGVVAPARVFVPLCGKSLDLVWFRDQGYQVEGVELSRMAVEAFFEEQGLSPQRRAVDDFEVWESDGIRIWCGDLFALRPQQLGQIDAIYDRAALIAMPEDLRPLYVRHLMDLTGRPGQLLVTLVYMQSQMPGPPFSVRDDEVRALYGDLYPGLQSPHHSQDVLADNARFAEQGLDALQENVYVLQVPKK